jgi:glutamyl-tRNA reductase
VAEREQELREKEEEVADMLECRRGKLSSHEATLEAEQKHVGDWRADLLAHELIVDLQVNHLAFKEKLLADKEKQLAKKQLHELATIHKRLEGL